MLRYPNTLLYLRRTISFCLHVVLAVLANAAAFWLRFDGAVPPDYQALGVAMLPWLVAIRLAVFAPLRLFEGLWKYTSIWDLRNIVLGVIGSSLVFAVVTVSFPETIQYPRSIFIIDGVLLICAMAAIRLTRRIYGELTQPHGA